MKFIYNNLTAVFVLLDFRETFYILYTYILQKKNAKNVQPQNTIFGKCIIRNAARENCINR